MLWHCACTLSENGEMKYHRMYMSRSDVILHSTTDTFAAKRNKSTKEREGNYPKSVNGTNQHKSVGRGIYGCERSLWPSARYACIMSMNAT